MAVAGLQVGPAIVSAGLCADVLDGSNDKKYSCLVHEGLPGAGGGRAATASSSLRPPL
jgi:hypothetical protein